jgi:hypothetical protein
VKPCTHCKLTLPVTDFHRLPTAKSGRMGKCKSCSKLYERSRRKERSELEKKYYRKNQQLVVDAYGGKCVCCGESEYKFLEIDHINGGGTQQRREMQPDKFYRWLRDDHPEGFRVLCSNCNRGRWRNGGECPHVNADVMSMVGGC